MNRNFLKIGFRLLAVAGLTTVASAAVVGNTRQLSGHVPAVVSQLSSTGRLAATNRLHLALGLPLRNREALTNLLEQIADPASPNYRHYLTPEEFTAQFGPTEQDYQAVIEFARTNGFAVTHTHSNRMLVSLEGQTTDVERSFHVNLKTYHHPNEARDFFAPDTEPTVATNLQVLSIQGMNNYLVPRPMIKTMPASKVKPGAGSGLGGSYLGKDFRNAYVPGSTLTGAGQMVGLLQFDGYLASDISTYASIAGLTNVPLQNVLLDGFNGQPYSPDGEGEVCLDIEMVMSMAPGVSKIVVFEGGPTGNPNDILNSMASSNQIKQLSASWGYPTDGTTEQIYQEFALQGQTYLNCSGDGDAWVGAIPFGACESPNITIVGGTTLTMTGGGQNYASETVWNWGFYSPNNWNPDWYWGSSGGISTDVTIPKWQQGVATAFNHGSSTMRTVPDIAFTADNIFTISGGGIPNLSGGTSAATPLWAGFMALVNQQAVSNNVASVGFLAPAVYALAKTTNYALCFHDVTTGDNTWDQSLTNFPAVVGYDLATGWGTPNGTNFINALATGVYNNGGSGSGSSGTPIISAPKQPWGTALSVMNGTDPNGPCFLFVQDTRAINTGIISNGWFVTLTTANPVGNAADNQVYATPANLALNVGAAWNFSVAVTNYGPSTSSNVFVTNNLPVGLTLVSSTPSLGSVTQLGSQLTWSLGTLANNQGAKLALSYSGGVAGSTYTNLAGVSSLGTTDPNPDDDSIVATATYLSALPPNLSALGYTRSGGFLFSVTNSPGQSVTIQASTDLVTPNWTPVFTGTSPFTFTNFDYTNYQKRFYRAVTGF